MNYLEAINSCLEGNKIRCRVMKKGEYINVENWSGERELRYWDKHHSGAWSYPQDIGNNTYQRLILSKSWIICNEIKAELGVEE